MPLGDAGDEIPLDDVVRFVGMLDDSGLVLITPLTICLEFIAGVDKFLPVSLTYTLPHLQVILHSTSGLALSGL